MKSSLVLGVATLLAGGGWYAKDQGYFNPPVDPVLTATVTRGELVINVTERGELESSQSLRVNCEIDGGGKLVTIAKEGTKVTKGEEVARFDTDALAKAISLQEVKCETADSKIKTAQGELEVQKNKAEGEIAKATLALTLADIDNESYLKAEYGIEYDKRSGALSNAKKDLEDAKDSLEFNRTLVKKGLAQPQQLRALELKVDATTLSVKQQEADIRVLEDYTKKRKVLELEAMAADAKRDLERTQKSQTAATAKVAAELAAAIKTADLEKQELARLKSQLDKCIVTAPGDGIVIHFNHRPWDPSSQVRAGATLHNQQTILTLPDLNQMKVKLKIHESVVKKIAVGLAASMQVEALPNQVLHGTVLNVASVAESDGGWRGGGVKEYETEVSITDLPLEAGLRPGMSAEVKILVKTIADALTVPVQAVTESDGKYIAYVVKSGAVERRIVKVGDSNEQFIQVIKGLIEGEQVALDARLRAAAELKQGEKSTPTSKPDEKNGAKIALATAAN